jgi:hypothetical protein
MCWLDNLTEAQENASLLLLGQISHGMPRAALNRFSLPAFMIDSTKVFRVSL